MPTELPLAKSSRTWMKCCSTMSTDLSVPVISLFKRISFIFTPLSGSKTFFKGLLTANFLCCFKRTLPEYWCNSAFIVTQRYFLDTTAKYITTCHSINNISFCPSVVSMVSLCVAQSNTCQFLRIMRCHKWHHLLWCECPQFLTPRRRSGVRPQVSRENHSKESLTRFGTNLRWMFGKQIQPFIPPLCQLKDSNKLAEDD